MKIGQTIKMAMRSLRTNKLRTFLTMLGVIIGVVAVSLLTTVTQVAKDTVVSQIKRESQTVILMMMTNDLSAEKFENVANHMRENEVSDFDYAIVYSKAASVNRDTVTVKPYDGSNADLQSLFQREVPKKTSVQVVSDNYFDLRNIEFFGSAIVAGEKNHCVVDKSFVDTFIGGVTDYNSVIGQTIVIGGQSQRNIVKISLVLANMLPATTEEEIEDKLEAAENEAAAVYNKVRYSLLSIYQSEFVAFDESMIEVVGEGAEAVYSLVFDLPIKYSYTDASLAAKITDILKTLTPSTRTCTVSTTEGFVGGNEYVISGVIKSESNFFDTSMASNNLNDFKDEESMRIVYETMSRRSAGNVYVLDSDYSEELSTSSDGDKLGISLVYVKFADESYVSTGASKIMISMVHENFLIDSFFIISMQSVANIINNVMQIMQILLGVIAGISLVVGGIGIMNIMLVVVSERTREIGITKAIGAKRRTILSQFLIEALIVTLIGGFVGIVLSAAFALIIGKFMGMLILLPWWVVLLSIGFCALIGVIFGMYPAVKASKMHPIDALRRE